MRVLVIDDSHSMGHLLVGALEQEGCTAHVARSATDALELARRFQPDVITMRTRCGLTGCAEDAAVRGIPIVAIGRGLPNVQAERVIGEPFYIEEVVAAVKDVLRLKVPTTVQPAARP